MLLACFRIFVRLVESDNNISQISHMKHKTFKPFHTPLCRVCESCVIYFIIPDFCSFFYMGLNTPHTCLSFWGFFLQKNSFTIVFNQHYFVKLCLPGAQYFLQEFLF